MASRMRLLSLDLPCADRCTKSAFIEVLFFVWCTLIAQIVLNVRYETVPSSIYLNLHCAHPYFHGVIGYMLSR